MKKSIKNLMIGALAGTGPIVGDIVSRQRMKATGQKLIPNR